MLTKPDDPMDRFGPPIKRMLVARQAIVAKHAAPDGTVVGEIDPCPVCKIGRLDYFIMPNGHVHGNCTAGCVAWME